jgi:hypothetical protein
MPDYSMPPDERPDDLAELARLTAIELRKRGIRAKAEVYHVFPHYVDIGSHIYYVGTSDFDNLGPIGCADVIQAEEARKAQEWAGDT